MVALSCANPAHAGLRGIAALDSSKGRVMVKSLGSWGVAPQEGMAFYVGDKILTKEGSAARILFHDDSVLDIEPNSVVRIIEQVNKDVEILRKEVKKRDIRVLLGKVRYKTGKVAETKVRLISPTLVTALTRTEVWFGTDGKQTCLEHVKGASKSIGNVTEGNVPEITSEQAGNDPNFQASLNSRRIWKEYFEAKRELEQQKTRTEAGAYRSLSRGDKVVSLDEVLTEAHVNLMGRLSKYAAEVSKENIAENTSLASNASSTVARKAGRSLSACRMSLNKAEEISELSKGLKQEIINLLEDQKISSANTNSLPALSSGTSASDAVPFTIAQGSQKTDSDIVTRATLEYNSMHEKMAMGYMMYAEVFTTGIPELVQEIAGLEDEAKTAWELAVKSFENVKKYASGSGQKNLKRAELNMALLSACSANMSLLANTTEIIQIFRSETVTDDSDQNALAAIDDEKLASDDALGQISDIVKHAEDGSRELSEPDNDMEKVKQMLKKAESSNIIHQNSFFDTAIRASMILSGPVLPELTLYGDTVLPGIIPLLQPLPLDTILQEVPVSDLEPASPVN